MLNPSLSTREAVGKNTKWNENFSELAANAAALTDFGGLVCGTECRLPSVTQLREAKAEGRGDSEMKIESSTTCSVNTGKFVVTF
jgi:hypothetical protein